MTTIHKYALEYPGITKILCGDILTAQFQDGELKLWAMQGCDARSERTVEVVGTGWKLSVIPRRYIATVQSGDFVWHVFELI